MSNGFRIKVLRIKKPNITPNGLRSLSLPFSVEAEKKTLSSTFMPFYLQNSYYQLNQKFGYIYTTHSQ